jgi:positive regulator of sigma E activity
MTKKKIFLKYFLFSFFSILINIVSQEITLYFYTNIFISIINGTITGFIFKFYVDKKYIFSGENTIFSMKELFLYASTAILTTIIFWSFELIFLYLFESKAFKIFGAVLGLSIGFLIKYQLDKKITFNSNV